MIVLKKCLILLGLLSLLILSGCGKTKLLHCDGCGKELRVAESSNMDEDWILFCEACDPVR